MTLKTFCSRQPPVSTATDGAKAPEQDFGALNICELRVSFPTLKVKPPGLHLLVFGATTMMVLRLLSTVN